MAKRDMRAIIENAKIEENYDLYSSEIVSLMAEAVGSQADLGRTIYDSFKYGYEMGRRAEMNRRTAKA